MLRDLEGGVERVEGVEEAKGSTGGRERELDGIHYT